MERSALKQVLAAAAAVKQQGLSKARSVMEDASEAVSVLEAILDTLRAATAASLPLLQMVVHPTHTVQEEVLEHTVY